MSGRHDNLKVYPDQGHACECFGNRADADDANASHDFERHVLYFSSNRSGRYQRVRLFSSDRQGGQGGYDLYLTALP